MGCALVLVVSSAVYIVELESHAEVFSCVYSEESLQVVFAVGAVATLVVCEVCYGRERVCESESAYGLYEVVVWLCEDELSVEGSVGKHAVYSWSAEVSCSIVFSSRSGGEDGVHEHVRQRVGPGCRDVAEAFIHSPYLQTFRYYLVLMFCRVSSASESVVCSGKSAVVVQLVVFLRPYCGRGYNKGYQCEDVSSCHFTSRITHSHILKAMAPSTMTVPAPSFWKK